MNRSRFAAVAAVAFACGNIFMATSLTSCSNKAGVAADSDTIILMDSDSLCAITINADSVLVGDSISAPVIEGVDINADVPAVQSDLTGEDLEIDLGYATYRGGLKNGLPDGQGTLTFNRNHKIIPEKDYVAKKGDVVEGVFRDGQVMTATWKKASGGSMTVSK